MSHGKRSIVTNRFNIRQRVAFRTRIDSMEASSTLLVAQEFTRFTRVYTKPVSFRSRISFCIFQADRKVNWSKSKVDSPVETMFVKFVEQMDNSNRCIS